MKKGEAIMERQDDPRPQDHPQEQIVTQFGVTLADGRVYQVDRSFFLEVEDGPLVPMKKGSLVRLAPRLGQELFLCGKVSPVELGEVFEVVRDFRTVDPNGKWLEVKRGDVIGLTREEAIALLRRGEIKEKRGGVE